MIIFLGFIQDSKVNTPHFNFAWDFFLFFLERVERVYVTKKAELPQNTASRKNEISPAQPIFPMRREKSEELKVKPKISSFIVRLKAWLKSTSL